MLQVHGSDPESIRRRLAEIDEAAEEYRDARNRFFRTLGLLILWPLLAVAGMGWGFQMSDPALARTVFYLFALAGNVGILVTLIFAYPRDR